MTRVFKYSNIQFAIELDLFENYVDKPIDVLSKDWHQLALELHGENEQIRNTGVEKLKVRVIPNIIKNIQQQ